MYKEQVEIFRTLKERSGLTNQQIQERSELSISTINRFFRGEIDNPDFDEVNRILVAMGYSLSNLADSDNVCISRYNIDELLLPYMESVAEPYKQQNAILQNEIERITEHHKHQLDLLQKDVGHLTEALSYRRKMCNIAFGVAIGLIAFICTMIVIDLTNTNVGWYRGVYNTFSHIFFGGASVL